MPMAVAKESSPPWMRRPGVTIAAYHAIILLHYGLLWVAVVLAWPRFSGVVDCSPVLSYSVVRYPLTYSYPLGLVSADLVASRRTWPAVSKDSNKGVNKDPLTLVVVGGVVLVAFIMLIAAADFVAPLLKGSLSAQVGSLWRDLWLVGVAVALHFIYLPIMAPKQRKME